MENRYSKTILFATALVTALNGCAPKLSKQVDPPPVSQSEKRVAPNFALYPVEITRSSKRADLKLKGAKALRYKTRLTSEWVAATAPNLADHFYAFQMIGCGTGCTTLFIADWKNGEIYWTGLDGFFAVRRDSRLVVSSPEMTCDYIGSRALYLWRENKLELLKADSCL